MQRARAVAVLGAGSFCAAAVSVAFSEYRGEHEAYHLLQTIPRTYRLLSWAVTAHCRYHAELAASGCQTLPPSTLSSLQRRNAHELAQVCRNNGGIFIKAAQFASNLATVPVEYREELGALMENDCVLPASVVQAMIEADTGKPLHENFLELSPDPLATASLAQVHKGTLQDGRVVAVKVQYPGVGYAAAADLRVCSWIASALTTLGVGGVAPMQRILHTLIARIRQEVDLRRELKNCERLRDTLSTPNVVVPKAMPELSSHRVLVMEWIDGVPLTDYNALQSRQIDPRAVGNSLLHAFADMVYVQGRMHGDMHPANVLVRGHGENFQVVLLDHGWHVDIPNKLRKQYCQLWCAFVLHDMDAAAAVAEEIAGPKARHIVPAVLQMASGSGKKDKSESSNDGLRVLGGLQHLEAVALLPTELVEILRSFQSVRALVNPLGLTSGDRLRVNCGYALQGIAVAEPVAALQGWQRVRSTDWLMQCTSSRSKSDCLCRFLLGYDKKDAVQIGYLAWPWQSSNQSWKEWRFSVRLSARITLLRALLWARSTKDYLLGQAVRV